MAATTVRPAGAVRRALTEGGPQAVLALAKAGRGPVVELAGGARGYDVTFVFSGRRRAPRDVGLFCPALPGGFARLQDLGGGVFANTTRLPSGTRVPYHFCLDPPARLDSARLAALARSPEGRQIDYLNPDFDQISLRGLRMRIVDSLLVLPGAPQAPPAGPRPDVPAGSLEELTIRSRELGRSKEIVIHHPAARLTDGPHPLVLLLQGNEEWQGKAFLDNLMSSGQVPPFTAVVLTERSVTARLRDFTSGAAHSRFITSELWPALAERDLTAGPAVAVAGYSAGGLAAAALAADEPGLFPRLAVISGALHLAPGTDPQRGDAGAARLLDRFRQQDAVPLRAYLATGWYEDAWDPGIQASTTELAGVLSARGTDVRFDTGPTGHDTVSARAYLAEGLRWLLTNR